MLSEHDRIVLTKDLPAHGLKAGDTGTIVHRYPGGEAFEAEFLADGETIAIATVPAASAHPASASARTGTARQPRG